MKLFPSTRRDWGRSLFLPLAPAAIIIGVITIVWNVVDGWRTLQDYPNLSITDVIEIVINLICIITPLLCIFCILARWGRVIPLLCSGFKLTFSALSGVELSKFIVYVVKIVERAISKTQSVPTDYYWYMGSHLGAFLALGIASWISMSTVRSLSMVIYSGASGWHRGNYLQVKQKAMPSQKTLAVDPRSLVESDDEDQEEDLEAGTPAPTPKPSALTVSRYFGVSKDKQGPPPVGAHIPLKEEQSGLITSRSPMHRDISDVGDNTTSNADITGRSTATGLTGFFTSRKAKPQDAKYKILDSDEEIPDRRYDPHPTTRSLARSNAGISPRHQTSTQQSITQQSITHQTSTHQTSTHQSPNKQTTDIFTYAHPLSSTDSSDGQNQSYDDPASPVHQGSASPVHQGSAVYQSLASPSAAAVPAGVGRSEKATPVVCCTPRTASRGNVDNLPPRVHALVGRRATEDGSQTDDFNSINPSEPVTVAPTQPAAVYAHKNSHSTYGHRDSTYGHRDSTYGHRDSTYGHRDSTYGHRDSTYGRRESALEFEPRTVSLADTGSEREKVAEYCEIMDLAAPAEKARKGKRGSVASTACTTTSYGAPNRSGHINGRRRSPELESDCVSVSPKASPLDVDYLQAQQSAV